MRAYRRHHDPLPLKRRVSGPPGNGLSQRDVAARVDSGLDNRLPDRSSRSLWQIFRANVLTLFNAIVGSSFLVLLFLGRWQDALFGLAAAGNAVIGVVQEYRAKRSLDRLAILDAPRARVLRDGSPVEIPTADVVRDDVLLLRAGDQVTADAAVLESAGLEADESLLTGESDPVDKTPGTEVLSGSIIVAGHAKARIVRVGAESFSSRLTADARRFSLVDSEIRRGLNQVLRWIAWAILPVALLVAIGEVQARGGWQSVISGGAWTAALVGVIASVIAMVPLGLVLLTSVAFAVGGLRLAGHKVLIQELAAVEGLARVDVLCMDKTGTLTEGGLRFEAVHQLTPMPAHGWQQALGWFASEPEANATARSLGAAFEDDGGFESASYVPFSSARKWSGVTFDVGNAAGPTWVLGAPDMLLGPAALHPEVPAPQTVAAIARRVGLEAASGFDARLLPEDPELLSDVMEQNTVFGRVSPQQKRAMVAALHRRGHTVAMTGDGVNDALALKAADHGIAMNSAAPATKAVARLILLDGRFDRLPDVVAEGRRVIANIERVSSLFLSKTAYAVAIAASFALLQWTFPFLPRQLSFTDGLTIGIPAFFLALMPNARRYQPGFLRRSLWFSLPAGVIVTASLIAVNAFALSTAGPATAPEGLRSASVLTLSVVGLWILSAVSRPLNARRLGVLAAMCAALVILVSLPLAQDFFILAWPPEQLLVPALLAGLGGGLLVELLAWLHRRRFGR